MKQWYQSRTIWVAIGQAVVAVITAYLATNPTIQVAGYLVMFKSIIDILLRCNTEGKIV